MPGCGAHFHLARKINKLKRYELTPRTRRASHAVRTSEKSMRQHFAIPEADSRRPRSLSMSSGAPQTGEAERRARTAPSGRGSAQREIVLSVVRHSAKQSMLFRQRSDWHERTERQHRVKTGLRKIIATSCLLRPISRSELRSRPASSFRSCCICSQQLTTRMTSRILARLSITVRLKVSASLDRGDVRAARMPANMGSTSITLKRNFVISLSREEIMLHCCARSRRSGI